MSFLLSSAFTLLHCTALYFIVLYLIYSIVLYAACVCLSADHIAPVSSVKIFQYLRFLLRSMDIINEYRKKKI